MALKSKDFEYVYQNFNSPVSDGLDCGQFCAPLNEGQPVCCTTQHAIPIVDRMEYKALRKRTNMWKKLKPFDAVSKKLIEEHEPECCAIECKGAQYCERDNRSIACRAFPFFPYLNKKREILGASIYWSFKDRCWVMSNLKYVDKAYLDELFSAYRYLFERDEHEEEAFFDQSVQMRRLYSRKGWPIPLLGLDGKPYHILPKSEKPTPVKHTDMEKYFPFNSMKNYREQVSLLDGPLKGLKLKP